MGVIDPWDFFSWPQMKESQFYFAAPNGKCSWYPLARKLDKPCLRFANGGVGKNVSFCQDENSCCPKLSLEHIRYTVPPGTERIIGVR